MRTLLLRSVRLGPRHPRVTRAGRDNDGVDLGNATVRVLGPVQIVGAEGGVVELPSASQRRLLAALALHAPAPVRAEWLCGILDVSPGSLRTSVSRVRRVLGGDHVQTTVGGYRLDAPVDAALARSEIEAAERDPEKLTRALARWVGPALAEFADEAWAVADAVRLAELRAAAVEDLADALIATHRAAVAVVVLEPHVIEHPFRDRPIGLVMRALAASGRQTEALRAYQRYREHLGETAGTEPSDDLRTIEQRIATGWDGLDDDSDVAAGAHRDLAPEPARLPRSLHEALAVAPTGVGRVGELAVLVDAAERVRSTGAQTALVSGEAGIGKTTLIASFARECTTSGWDVFYGRCDEHVSVPFQPFPEVVGRMVDTLPDDVLNAHMATCGGDLLRLLPRLERRIAAPLPPAGDESTARHRLFEAVVDLIRRAATIAPLVLVLDDLHWAEPATLQLLRHLVNGIVDAPVLVLAGFRDTGEAAGDHLRSAVADLARHDAVRVELTGLDSADLSALVRERIASTAGRDVSPVADRLHAETAGNPLFAEHLLRHWSGAGQLDVADDVVTLAAPAAVDVPSSLRDLVWYRVKVLGPDAQPTLTAAAVLGVQFNERVLAVMTDLADHEVAGVLDRAVAAGVLADQASISGNVRFAHALVARSLEAELGTRARAGLHAQAYEAMLAVNPTPSAELAPHLARHAELGGLLAESLQWASEAGDLAMADLAPDEAAVWFARALEHATALDRPDGERAELLVRLGEAATRAGHPTALETIRQGAELAQACGDDATLVRAALATDRGSLRFGSFAPDQLAIVEAALPRVGRDDLTTRAILTALLAQCLGHTDQGDRRRESALVALDLARSSLDPTVLARVAPNILWALMRPGTGAIRAVLAAEATAAVDEMDDPHLAFRLYQAAHGSAVCAGDAERARSYLDRLHAIADEVGEPVMRWGRGLIDGFVATMEARFADADRIVAETLDLGTRSGDPEAFALFLLQYAILGMFAGRHDELFPVAQQAMESDPLLELPFRLAYGILCCEVGRREEASTLLHDAIAGRLGSIPHDHTRTTTLIALATLAVELDDVAAADWLYPQIVPMADEVSFNGVTSQGPISAYAGKLAFLLERYDDAERHLLDALATADAFGWVYHRATTLIGLARNRLRAEGALDDEGERWLATAEELCTTHGINSWTKRTKALRAQLAAI